MFYTAMPMEYPDWGDGRAFNMKQDIKLEKIDGGIWCPIFTLSKNEKKLSSFLIMEGIPAYLPMRKHINIQLVVSKGKSYCYKRELHVPMFPNYIFANITPEFRTELGKNRSVIRILNMNESQENVLINELKVIHKLEEFSETEEIDVTAGLTSGKKVRFIDGAFKGWEGVVSDVDGKTGMAYINVTSVEASVRLKYPAAWCCPAEAAEEG